MPLIRLGNDYIWLFIEMYYDLSCLDKNKTLATSLFVPSFFLLNNTYNMHIHQYHHQYTHFKCSSIKNINTTVFEIYKYQYMFN